LKLNHPNEFEILTNTMVKYNFYKKDQYDLSYTDALIKLDPINRNKLTQIRYNAYYQPNVNHLKNQNEIKQFFKALKKYVEIINLESNQLWLSLDPNQILIFNNFRMLHGRSAFKGNRTLVTTYLPQDEWISKANILGVNK
jgi:alpha-ketoglutarate-dependent taurine dioxygenase